MPISKEDFIRAVENSKSSEELGLRSALPFPPKLYCPFPASDPQATEVVVKHLEKLIEYYTKTEIGRKLVCKYFDISADYHNWL